MANVDMCEHGWPGSGCRECFPAPTEWIEIPVVIDGIDGFCALKIPYGSDIEAVKQAVAALPTKKAVFHG